MGDGTCSKIATVGNAKMDTSTKLLHLSNVLHVHKIRINLLSVS